MKKQFLFLALALILALLAGCTQAPSVLETPGPGNLTDPQAQPQGQPPAAEQRGSGSFDLTDPAVGLAELPRYQAVLILRFDGTRDGQPYRVEKTYTLSVDRSIPATFLMETALQPDGSNVARFSGLLGAVRYSQSAPDQPCQAVEAASDEMEFTPALMLPPPVCVNGLRQQDAEFTVARLSVSPPKWVGNSESCGKVDRRALPTFPQLLRLRRGRLIRS